MFISVPVYLVKDPNDNKFVKTYRPPALPETSLLTSNTFQSETISLNRGIEKLALSSDDETREICPKTRNETIGDYDNFQKFNNNVEALTATNRIYFEPKENQISKLTLLSENTSFIKNVKKVTELKENSILPQDTTPVPVPELAKMANLNLALKKKLHSELVERIKQRVKIMKPVFNATYYCNESVLQNNDLSISGNIRANVSEEIQISTEGKQFYEDEQVEKISFTEDEDDDFSDDKDKQDIIESRQIIFNRQESFRYNTDDNRNCLGISYTRQPNLEYFQNQNKNFESTIPIDLEQTKGKFDL
jgi:hypothetical protein